MGERTSIHLSTTEILLIAMTSIVAMPYLIWRVGGMDYCEPVVAQIITGILLGPGTC